MAHGSVPMELLKGIKKGFFPLGSPWQLAVFYIGQDLLCGTKNLKCVVNF